VGGGSAIGVRRAIRPASPAPPGDAGRRVIVDRRGGRGRRRPPAPAPRAAANHGALLPFSSYLVHQLRLVLAPELGGLDLDWGKEEGEGGVSGGARAARRRRCGGRAAHGFAPIGARRPRPAAAPTGIGRWRRCKRAQGPRGAARRGGCADSRAGDGAPATLPSAGARCRSTHPSRRTDERAEGERVWGAAVRTLVLALHSLITAPTAAPLSAREGTPQTWTRTTAGGPGRAGRGWRR